MKKWIVLSLAMASATQSQASTIHIAGDGISSAQVMACPGPHIYGYGVGADSLSAIDSVLIATHDPVLSNYTDICVPAGWSFDVIPATLIQPHYSTATPVGQVSPEVDGFCPYTIVMANRTGSPIAPNASFTFGFNNPSAPHNVDYYLHGAVADFAEPVGLGLGPLYAPGGPDTASNGSIHGSVWHDWNGNGVLDADEPPIEGWMVTIRASQSRGFVRTASIYRPFEDTVHTDFRGNFGFVGLPAGTYTVKGDSLDSWTRTFPALSSHTVSLSLGEDQIGRQFGYRHGVPCPDSVACCGGKPALAHTVPSGFGGPYLGQVAVVTCLGPEAGPVPPSDFSVGMIDLSQQCSRAQGPPGWTPPPSMYHNEAGQLWTTANLGDVFGLTLDASGNIYVASTAVYQDFNIFGFVDRVGPGGAGAIYKLNGATGAITTFVGNGALYDMPNDPTTNPGLGNITYSCHCDRFYVANIEDGLIYAFDALGAFIQTYDHGVTGRNAAGLAIIPDVGGAGATQLGRRVFAVQVASALFDGGVRQERLFYSVWSEDDGNPNGNAANEIWSVPIDGDDCAIAIPDGPDRPRLEMKIPAYMSTTSSNPVTDISFRPDGTMLLAERSMGGWGALPSNSYTSPSAHRSRLLSYRCLSGVWQPESVIYEVGTYQDKTNSAGGVDFDYDPYPVDCPGRTWVTGDALGYGPPDWLWLYGAQGLPSNGLATQSLFIDFNGVPTGADKTQIGDVEIPCCDTCIANGDIDGDNNALAVADLAYLINFVDNGGPAPNPPCRADLNDDGFIDYGDIKIFQDYFVLGSTVFPQYPVVTVVCVDTTRGACCEGDTCHVRSQANCELLGGLYFGTGTRCTTTTCLSIVSGCKFNDLNGNGVWDQPGEPTMPGVTINLSPSPPGYSVVTGPGGCYDFYVPAGTYTVSEVVPPGMTQTAPASVAYTVDVPPNVGLYAGDFGNMDTTCAGARYSVTQLNGNKDHFNSADGPEPSSPSGDLVATYTCPNGADDLYDENLGAECLGNTFTGFKDPSCIVRAAQFCIKVINSQAVAALPSPGHISFLQKNAGGQLTEIWTVGLGTLDPIPPFNGGDIFEVCLNLAALPPSTGTTSSGNTNVLMALQDGDFDVAIHGTGQVVDYMELRVDLCCRWDAIVECCGGKPPLATTLGYTKQIAIATCMPDCQLAAGRFPIGMIDLSEQCNNPYLGWGSSPPYSETQAAPVGMFHNDNHPTEEWNKTNLGPLFGVTLDKFGNIFTTPTSSYGYLNDNPCNPDVFPGGISGAGNVYRIDGATGDISIFLTLLNNGQGLGNISYDCRNDNLYVSNMDDGLIYRICQVNGLPCMGIPYDHGTQGRPAAGLSMLPDDGNTQPSPLGFTQLGRRVWAVHVLNGTVAATGTPIYRLFYSVWWDDCNNQNPSEANEIWSVGLDPANGAFLNDARREIVLPDLVPYPSGAILNANAAPAGPWSSPVADIDFTADGKMLASERTMRGTTTLGAHASRLLEFECTSSGWERKLDPTTAPDLIDIFRLEVGSLPYPNAQFTPSTAGGVAVDFLDYDGGTCPGRIWATADALYWQFPFIYGMTGMPRAGGITSIPNSSTNPAPNCILIDLDNVVTTGDKFEIGDVAVACDTIPFEETDCACDCHADPSCDTATDILDVVACVNVAFRGFAEEVDPNPNCPYRETDVDCTGSTDVVDIVRIVNVAFRGANAATEFCNPCP